MIEDVPGKFYTIIKAKCGVEEKYTDIEYLLGKKLLSKRTNNEDFIKYVKSEIRKINVIIKNMKLGANTEKEIKKIEDLKSKYEEILK